MQRVCGHIEVHGIETEMALSTIGEDVVTDLFILGASQECAIFIFGTDGGYGIEVLPYYSVMVRIYLFGPRISVVDAHRVQNMTV